MLRTVITSGRRVQFVFHFFQHELNETADKDEQIGYKVGGEWMAMNITVTSFPQCRKCEAGSLLPVSDSWKCSNPDCDFEM